MKRILLFSLFTLLVSSGICADPPGSTTDQETTSTSEVTKTTFETTSTSEATTSTTVPSTTTSEATTSTTIPSTTSTSIPKTTTTAPEPTTEPTTTSTTSKPVTTTEVPVTTKAPEPIPKPVKGSWNITQNNVTCIRAELEILFVIPVEKNKEYIALSPNATSGNSECHLTNDTQLLVLTDVDYTLSIIFERKAGKAYVTNITLEYTLQEETGFVYNDKQKFSVNVGHSYRCRNEEDVALGNITMEVMSIQIQAFGSESEKGFATAEECEADDKVGDAVPIAVACALAALIIVVLIAYLVGRRRSRQRGYQSV